MKLSDTWHDGDTRHVSSPDPGAGQPRGPHRLHVEGDVREVVSEVARVVQVPLPTTYTLSSSFTSVAFLFFIAGFFHDLFIFILSQILIKEEIVEKVTVAAFIQKRP